MQVVGIDWATAPKNRALVRLSASGAGVVVMTVEDRVPDARVREICVDPAIRAVAIDAPFGWPKDFSRFVSLWWGDHAAGLVDGSLSRARSTCAPLVEEALVDAYGEDEQHEAFLVMFEEHIKCPFTALVVGEEVEVRGFDWEGAPQEIVAVCRRRGRNHRVNVTALHFTAERPVGEEWLDAYRAWLRGNW